ncbi:hypothetical protein DB31_3047 [Hyalangium minutum]|uniref:Uncharacterized protein n=1 Tax=Hyalangium minutum TaxID=394096 RepID=A0A085W5M5_9BACT|nr:hypothetical protein DB31_3047 [Hyalangium minutum]
MSHGEDSEKEPAKTDFLEDPSQGADIKGGNETKGKERNRPRSPWREEIGPGVDSGLREE